MKSRIAAIVIAVACMAGAPVAVAAAPSGAHRADPPVARSAGCVYAKIMGARKCLRRGEYCRHYQPAMRQYRRHGFKCSKRDRRGDWHLEYS